MEKKWKKNKFRRQTKCFVCSQIGFYFWKKNISIELEKAKEKTELVFKKTIIEIFKDINKIVCTFIVKDLFLPVIQYIVPEYNFTYLHYLMEEIYFPECSFPDRSVIRLELFTFKKRIVSKEAVSKLKLPNYLRKNSGVRKTILGPQRFRIDFTPLSQWNINFDVHQSCARRCGFICRSCLLIIPSTCLEWHNQKEKEIVLNNEKIK